MVEFGARLRKLRKQKSLTQKQLADLIGVRNSVISFYEVGERMPSLDIIIKLSRVFHVSADYLLGLSHNETVDISNLSEADKALVVSIVSSLNKNNGLSK